ncbi:hypothetical protein HU200_057842 [Digitaria exilis]|uniref:Uncharacterized protein n=1 Tax=Digitaria exilis TaxID=1010633 RepID=A0A835DZL5_9POAL|nr:hypothetical protein HU200_057842 [Digitaria exilis]
MGAENRGSRPRFESSPFRVGGHAWRIGYYPRGTTWGNSDFISLYLVLDDIVDDEAMLAQFTLSLLDQEKNPVSCSTTHMNNFSEHRVFGYDRFIKREILERPEYLKDDSFTIRVQIHVVNETPSVLVPPPDIQQHIGSLLLSMEGGDVEFRVAGEAFVAHRLVLAARSPIFNAELYGPMKEGIVANTIQIDDMEAQVFKAMLDFIYTDSWPEMEQEDESAMAQHLLVAAAVILALAEMHSCSALKEACFNFLSSSTSLLEIMEAQECEYLAQSCPAVMEELNAIFLARDLEKAKISEGIEGDTPSDHKN